MQRRALVPVVSAEARESMLRRLEQYRMHVIEEVLTLKCPRAGCHMAFIDFDGERVEVEVAVEAGLCG